MNPLQMAVSLLALITIAAPVAAQAGRYPTDAEVQSLTQQLKRRIPQLQQSRIYSDRRTPTERQQRERFVSDWAAIDPTVAPFLGMWTAIEETKMIYPSRTKGQVCIIDTFLPSKPGESGYEFELGTVSKGMIRSSDRTQLVKEGEFLGTLFVAEGKAHLYEYAHPRPLQHPASQKYLSKDRQIVEQFRQHGCVADFTK